MIERGSCPKCTCGEQDVFKFRNDGMPRPCNEGWDCKKFKRDIVARRAAALTDHYGPEGLKSDKVRRKARRTCMQRYGVANAAQAENIKQKIADTNLERYGATNVYASKYGKREIRRTLMRRYGVNHSSRIEGVTAKTAATNFSRRGVSAPAKDPAVMRKMKNTCMNRYGVTNAFQNKTLMKKAERTMLRRYGVTHSMRSPKIRARIAETNLRKYGAVNVFASAHGKRAIAKTMLHRYGVRHALQHPEFFAKQQRSAYRYERFWFGGRIVRTQGWERAALYHLSKERGIEPKRIALSMEDDIAPLRYRVGSEPTKLYHPDMVIDDERIVEVKSSWTLYGSARVLYIAQAKAKGCLNAGFKFTLVLVRGRTYGHKWSYVLPRSWMSMTRGQLKSLVAELDQRRLDIADGSAIPKRKRV